MVKIRKVLSSGARFTKLLKLKIFVSSIRKILGLRCLVKRAPDMEWGLIAKTCLLLLNTSADIAASFSLQFRPDTNREKPSFKKSYSLEFT